MSGAHAEPITDGGLYKDINALRKVDDTEGDEDAELHAKLNNTFWARIVKNKVQEIATLMVIVLNALFIGYDTDYSARWSRPDGLYEQGSKWGFPFMENFFCVYFTGEVLIRFMAWKEWESCYTDGWFVFDGTLVFIMILETWVLEFIGGDGIPIDMDMLRLLRLLRITRMGKLMRFFPELAIIVKGMVAALRSVGCTGVLMVLVLYVFSIIFTDAYHQGHVLDDVMREEEEGSAKDLFGSMGKSMRHLFIMGTILDDITACTNSIRVGEKATQMMIFFVIFVLVSSFTMLNMLIGILCEVVCAVSDGEAQKNTEATIREAIGNLFKSMDEDGSGAISRNEFMGMKTDEAVLDALGSLNVEAKHFDMYAELMFNPPEDGSAAPVMNLENTINMIMRLRPGSKVSALDFASFQQAVYKNNSYMKHQISRIDKMMSNVIAYDPEVDDPDRDMEGGDENGSRTGSKASVQITMADLEPFATEDILRELQKRIGSDPAKMPSYMTDQMSNARMVEAFESLCAPQIEGDREAWSKETYTC